MCSYVCGAQITTINFMSTTPNHTTNKLAPLTNYYKLLPNFTTVSFSHNIELLGCKTDFKIIFL